jgi:hypothetical protein
MPQSELDKIDGQEYKELAEALWFLHRDRADGAPFPFLGMEIRNTGFPNETAQLAELLTQPDERKMIHDGLIEFAAAVEQDNSLLRFRHSHSN